MNSSPAFISRRRLFASLSIIATGVTLTGCAQKGPSPPPPQLQPLLRVGILPVLERATTGDAFAFVKENTRQYEIPVAAAPSPAAAAFAIGFNIAGAGRRARFDQSMTAVNFDPRAYFESSIAPAFRKEGIKLERVTDPQLATAYRTGKPIISSPDLDAVLDVQITSAGYYQSDRAGGYSPMLYVVARFLSASRSDEELGRFGYDSDYRPAEGELRFYTTPQEISVATPEDIVPKAKLVRETMERISDRIIAQIIVDVDRRMRAVPRLP